MHRKGMGRSACLDPGTLTDRHNEPLFRLIDDAWGKVWVSAAERPADLFVTPDSITAEPILF